MAQMRLDKYLANASGRTRTEIKQLLKKGCVTVNDIVMKKPEQKIDPDQDRIMQNGSLILLEEFFYYMLNKPAGCVSATEDNLHPVVLDYIKEPRKEELFPVGRLDIDTVGLLLITNDGALAHDLLSPRKHVDKTYYARIEGIVTEEDCVHFTKGLDIGEKKETLPARLTVLRSVPTEDGTGCSEIEITIREGKFHQVKRMFEAVGKRVTYLKRISMGSLQLDPTLPEGAYRRLTEKEIMQLKNN